MLAMSDQDGIVEASIPGLARRAGVTVDVCEKAISTFLAPDPYSRTRDLDGRRIEEVDGGWRLLNHDKYRAKQNIEDVRERAAERQRRYVERKKASANVSERQQASANVSADGNDTNNAIRSDHLISSHLTSSNTPLPPQGGKPARKPRTVTIHPDATGLLAELSAARIEVIPGARPLNPTTENLKFISERLASGNTPDDIRHVIRVCAEETRRGSNPVYFDAITPFRPDNFAKKVGASLTARHREPGEPARVEPLPFDQVFGAFKDELR